MNVTIDAARPGAVIDKNIYGQFAKHLGTGIYGGNMTLKYYANLYNQYAVFIRARSGSTPKLIASGGDLDWTEQLSTKKRIRDYRRGISFHYYTIPTGDWEKKGGGLDRTNILRTGVNGRLIAPARTARIRLATLVPRRVRADNMSSVAASANAAVRFVNLEVGWMSVIV